MSHLTTDELMAGADTIREAPRGAGTVELIVRRPAEGEREVLAEGQLDLIVGLVGDTWKDRPSTRTPDRSPHPDMQLNIMNAARRRAVRRARQGGVAHGRRPVLRRPRHQR